MVSEPLQTKIRQFVQVHADLLKSGFVPNESKCVWEPIQVITWLGAVLNTSTSEISTTDKRINGFKRRLSGSFGFFVVL